MFNTESGERRKEGKINYSRARGGNASYFIMKAESCFKFMP
jgi:hypothetical protein